MPRTVVASSSSSRRGSPLSVPATRIFTLPKFGLSHLLPILTRRTRVDAAQPDAADWLPARRGRTEYTAPIRSVPLTIFWRCGCCHFSSRNDALSLPATNRQRFWPRIWGSKGLAMLIRGQIDGISGEVALAAATIPAALQPTLLLGGLLLTCP